MGTWNNERGRGSRDRTGRRGCFGESGDAQERELLGRGRSKRPLKWDANPQSPRVRQRPPNAQIKASVAAKLHKEPCEVPMRATIDSETR